MKEHFSKLFLSEDASLDDVKKAYRKLAKRFHPDQNDNSDEYINEFRQVKESYEVLLNYFANKTEKTYTENQKAKSETEFNTEKHTVNDLIKFNKEKTVFEPFTVKIHNVYIIDKIITPSIIQYTNGLFLLIKVEIINNTNETIIMHEYAFSLLKKGGYSYNQSFKGLDGVVFRGFEAFDYKECHPGIPAVGFLAFEIPNKDDYILTMRFPEDDVNMNINQNDFSTDNFNEIKNKKSIYNTHLQEDFELPYPPIVYVLSILLIILSIVLWFS